MRRRAQDRRLRPAVLRGCRWLRTRTHEGHRHQGALHRPAHGRSCLRQLLHQRIPAPVQRRRRAGHQRMGRGHPRRRGHSTHEGWRQARPVIPANLGYGDRGAGGGLSPAERRSSSTSNSWTLREKETPCASSIKRSCAFASVRDRLVGRVRRGRGGERSLEHHHLLEYEAPYIHPFSSKPGILSVFPPVGRDRNGAFLLSMYDTITCVTQNHVNHRFSSSTPGPEPSRGRSTCRNAAQPHDWFRVTRRASPSGHTRARELSWKLRHPTLPFTPTPCPFSEP